MVKAGQTCYHRKHTAKAFYGGAVYFDGDEWNSTEVVSPLDDKIYAIVINLELRSDSVHYKFAVTKLAADWKPCSYLLCNLDVSLGSGKICNVKHTPISQNEWPATPDAPMCQPPMPQERYQELCK
jgi:hypothetical protein